MNTDYAIYSWISVVIYVAFGFVSLNHSLSSKVLMGYWDGSVVKSWSGLSSQHPHTSSRVKTTVCNCREDRTPSSGTAHTWYINVHAGKTHTHRIKINL